MGKTKQVKEKKFDRNVEISAPILDPEIIKAIHTPPKGQRSDVKNGGFKALLSDLNSQDSIDELTPLNDNHVPSYIGISCAVSGYSNYSSYSKRSGMQESSHTSGAALVASTPNRSRTNSPLAHRMEQHQIHHITIDKNNIHSADDERRELTEKLTASATERRRSPSPCIPPTEDDRHHGAYVGARYCPLPPPSKIVNKHIPLLGIDDEQDPDTVVEEDTHTVEQKIASLYGGDFVEDWRESQTHKAKKELPEDPNQKTVDKQNLKTPKDLVTLKPTPLPEPRAQAQVEVDVPTPDVKVLANVEKQFLNKLLTDDNPPKPSPPPHSVPSPSPVHTQVQEKKASLPKSPSPPTSPSPVELKQVSEASQGESPKLQSRSPPLSSPTTHISSDTLNSQFKEEIIIPPSEVVVEHTRFEVSSQSPTNNDSSPIRNQELLDDSEPEPSEATEPLKPLKSLEHSEPLELLQSINLTSSAQYETTETPVNLDSPKPSEGGMRNLVSFSPEPLESIESAGQMMEEHIHAHMGVHDMEERVHSDMKIADMEERIHSDVSVTDTEEHVHSDMMMPVMEERIHSDMSVPGIAESIENLETVIGDSKKSVESLEASLEGAGSSVVGLQTLIGKEADRVENLIEEGADKVKALAEKEADKVGDLENQVVTAVEKLSPLSDSNDGRYYLELLDKEKSFILEQVERAQIILDEQESQLDEDTLGRIRSAIGKANLLINKKCNQFRELCEANMSTNADEQYATLNDDLAGFWDMLSIQVADVRKSFETLWQAAESDWSHND